MTNALSQARTTHDTHRHSHPALVICVAGSPADLAQLSELVDRYVHVLLVSSPDDVPDLLRGVASPEPPHDEADPVVVLPQLRLDSDRRIASWFGNEVGLTPLEHDLLACLLAKPGRMWSFEALYECVWRTPYLGNRTEIHSLVKRLRSKLKRLNDSVLIEAVRGVGFRLVLPTHP